MIVKAIYTKNSRLLSWQRHALRCTLCCWLSVIMVGLAVARPVFAELPRAQEGNGTIVSIPARDVIDVLLSPQAMLEGHLLGNDDGPISGATITLVGKPCGQSQKITGWSDGAGRFSLGPISGGVLTIIVEQNAVMVRVWADRTGPPIAARQLILKTVNATQRVVRGQSPIGEFFWSDPFLVGATIVGAIAIPIAIHANRHTDKPSGS